MKNKYIKINDNWHKANLIKNNGEESKYFTNHEALLLKLGEKTRENLLKEMNRKTLPQLIIIDGVDGVGKTTIVEKLIEKFKSQGLKVINNTFKRRRSDNPKFTKPTIKYEWMFRKEVVEQINKRMITYDKEDIILLDKSPYCEYFYQKTNSFDRGYIKPYGNYRMETEIFKYKDIIDNAIIIFLENKACWDNYYKRETKKDDGGHKSSYETLKKTEYLDMVKMFKEHQLIYENKKKYKAMEIKNDNESWKRIYNQIVRFIKDEY
jgi:thymidylate kinase